MLAQHHYTRYAYACDNCEQFSPEMKTERGAREKARCEGWKQARKWTGIDYIIRHLCPVCTGSIDVSTNQTNWTIEEI